MREPAFVDEPQEKLRGAPLRVKSRGRLRCGEVAEAPADPERLGGLLRHGFAERELRLELGPTVNAARGRDDARLRIRAVEQLLRRVDEPADPAARRIV